MRIKSLTGALFGIGVLIASTLVSASESSDSGWLEKGWRLIEQDRYDEAIRSWQLGVNNLPDGQLLGSLGYFSEFSNALSRLKLAGKNEKAFIIHDPKQQRGYHLLTAREILKDIELRQIQLASLKQKVGLHGRLLANESHRFKSSAVTTTSAEIQSLETQALQKRAKTEALMLKKRAEAEARALKQRALAEAEALKKRAEAAAIAHAQKQKEEAVVKAEALKLKAAEEARLISQQQKAEAEVKVATIKRKAIEEAALQIKASKSKAAAEAKAVKARAESIANQQRIEAEAQASAMKQQAEAVARTLRLKAEAEIKTLKMRAEAEAKALRLKAAADALAMREKARSEAARLKRKVETEVEIIAKKRAARAEAEATALKQQAEAEAKDLQRKQKEAAEAEARRLIQKAEKEAQTIREKAAEKSRSTQEKSAVSTTEVQKRSNNPSREQLNQQAHTAVNSAEVKPSRSLNTEASIEWIKEGWFHFNISSYADALLIWQRGLNQMPDERLLATLGAFSQLGNALNQLQNIGSEHHAFIIRSNMNGREIFYVLSASNIDSDIYVRQEKLASLKRAAGISKLLLAIESKKFKSAPISDNHFANIKLYKKIRPVQKAETNIWKVIESNSFTINRFEVTGNKLLPTDYILISLRDYYGDKKTRSDMKQIRSDVINLYQMSGYSRVKVNLPKQLAEDTIEIRINEDRIKH